MTVWICNLERYASIVSYNIHSTLSNDSEYCNLQLLSVQLFAPVAFSGGAVFAASSSLSSASLARRASRYSAAS